MASQLIKPVIALLATTPRLDFLNAISLPSIMAQSHLPDAVVVVADQRDFSELERQSLQAIVGCIPLICLHNSFSPGAAGSWNTGIHYIKKSYAGSYLAILDDDDAWHPEHLATCLACSDHGKADLVLSGIHVVKAGAIVATNIPKNICADDFLVGNPGWQGSNTFVAIDVITAVGGFTDGLISSNDRDLAIRLLSNGHQAINYTGIATVHWHCDHCDSALSAPGSAQKRLGCAQFLKLHGHRMSSQQMFNKQPNVTELSCHGHVRWSSLVAQGCV